MSGPPEFLEAKAEGAFSSEKVERLRTAGDGGRLDLGGFSMEEEPKWAAA